MRRVARRTGGRLASLVAVGINVAPGNASAQIAAVTAAPVPAVTYVQTECQAVAQAHSKLTANQALVTQATQAYQTQPSEATAAQVKQAFVSYLQAGLSIVNDLVAQWKAAGIPDTKNGAAFAKAVIALQRTGVALFKRRITQAQRIDLSSASRFAASANALQAGLRADATKVRQQALRNPVITSAPTVLHPLVMYVTTTAATCAA